MSGHYTLTEADTFICMDSPNFIVGMNYGRFEIGDECTWNIDVSDIDTMQDVVLISPQNHPSFFNRRVIFYYSPG